MNTIGSMSQVWKGSAERTSGGLTKANIGRKSVGTSCVTGKTVYRYYSKEKSKIGKKNPWILAVQSAKKKLKIDKHTFIAPRKRGGTKEQNKLYKTARKIYDEE